MSAITRRHALTLATGAVAVTAVAALVAMPQMTEAQSNGYSPVAKPVNTATANKVEVLEFMWLGCPHCFAFEPFIHGWTKDMPEHASFLREAPPLNPSWEPHSRGFYAARALGLEDAFVEAMFNAIHNERKNMREPADIAELAATVGADEDEFLTTMTSFSVETAMRRSVQLAIDAGITGVPAVMINGKYLTSASQAGGNQGMIDVIDRMVDVEKESMGL